MNSLDSKTNDAYKECACSGCTKNGINHLRIVFLHKHGWFCESCATELTRLGLIDEEGIESA